jgi:hypothetical protein
MLHYTHGTHEDWSTIHHHKIIRSWNCEQKLTIFIPRFHDFMDNQKLGMEPQMEDQTGHQLGEDFPDN